MTIQCTRVPQKTSASYLAAKAMLNSPPLPPQEIFQLADFGPIKNRMTKLSIAIRDGWLIELPGGRIIVSEFAQAHFDKSVPEPVYVGEKAAPREVPKFKPKAPQLRAASRGLRADAMDNSLKAMPSHWSKVNP